MHPLSDGKPMASHIIDIVRELDVYRKVLVTQYDEIAALAPDFKLAKNEHPELGISLSMQLGIEAAGDADAYMFCVCDQPYITKESICRLIDAYCSSDAGIVSLSWQGQMYNPKIFSSTYKDELMSLSGDTGGRQIIKDHEEDILLVEAKSEEEVLDIDTIETI